MSEPMISLLSHLLVNAMTYRSNDVLDAVRSTTALRTAAMALSTAHRHPGRHILLTCLDAQDAKTVMEKLGALDVRVTEHVTTLIATEAA